MGADKLDSVTHESHSCNEIHTRSMKSGHMLKQLACKVGPGKQGTETGQGNPPLLHGHCLLPFGDDVLGMEFHSYYRFGIAFSILLLMGFCCFLDFPYFSI